MGRRSKKLNAVVTPEKPGNIGAKRKSKNEMDRSTKKQKSAASAPTNDDTKFMKASIPEKKLPAAASLDENSTLKSKEEVERENPIFEESASDEAMTEVAAVPEITQPPILSKNDDIDDDNEGGKSDQAHVDEPTEDFTAPGESGKTDDVPQKMSKKGAKKKSKKQPTKDCTVLGESGKVDDEPKNMSKKRLKKNSKKQPTEDRATLGENGKTVDGPQKMSKKRSKKKSKKQAAEANPCPNKEDEASGDEKPVSKALFVGNLSFLISKDKIMEFFKDAGEIVAVRLPVMNGRLRGFGYVEFTDETAARKAIKKNKEELMGREVKLEYYKLGHDSKVNGSKSDKGPNLNIYVQGFDKSQPLKEIHKSLREHFGSCGEIPGVLTPINPESGGGSKGYAFLHFKDQDAFSKALELDNTNLGNCTLTVKERTSRGDNCCGGGFVGTGGGKHGGFGNDGGRHGDFGGSDGIHGGYCSGAGFGNGGCFGGGFGDGGYLHNGSGFGNGACFGNSGGFGNGGCFGCGGRLCGFGGGRRGGFGAGYFNGGRRGRFDSGDRRGGFRSGKRGDFDNGKRGGDFDNASDYGSGRRDGNFDSGRCDGLGGGDALHSKGVFSSSRNSDSIFCGGGSFGGGSDSCFHSGNSFRGGSRFGSGRGGEFGGGGQGRGGDLGRGGSQSRDGGQACDGVGDGGALDSSSDFKSNRNIGFGGCSGCDSIFCGGGSFDGGSHNGFDGSSGFGGSKDGDGGGQGRGGGRSHSGSRGCGGSRSRGGGRSHGGGRGRGGYKGRGGSRGRH